MINEFKNNPFVSWGIDFIKKHIKFVRYCIIGFSGVLVDNVVFYILVEHLHMYYQYANAIGVSCGIINNFILNSFFNFKKKDKFLLRFVQFYAVGLIGMAINAGLLYCFIELMQVNTYLAKFANTFFVAVVQYFLNKAYSFKDKISKKVLVAFIVILVVGYVAYRLKPFFLN